MVVTDALFERSETQFFHQQPTKDALIDLAGHDEVVLYCGAGVTIDRTGLGWMDLIKLALRPKDDDGNFYIADADLDRLTKSLDPQRLASVLHHHVRQRYPNPQRGLQYVVNELRRELYQRHTWSGGRLVDLIAHYAVILALARVQVTIVTSNYDTHIEQAIDDKRRALKKERKSVPGLRVEAVARKAPLRNPRSTSAALKPIRLIYIHGRVPPDTRSTGPIVLDEVDYAESRARTTDTLRSLLDRKGVAAVIVGASLSDPPLIESLAMTRARSESRYALIPISFTGITDNSPSDVPRLLEHLCWRCESLGVNLLVPDFKVQVAQFFEELIVGSGLRMPIRYLEADGPSYGKRLVRWWNDWSTASNTVPFVAATYLALNNHIRRLRSTLKLDQESERNGEMFKLEVWVRWEPTTRRSMALWGSSLGVLLARDLLRQAELVLDSGQASARCFTEGRPQHVDLDQVQPPRSSYRKSPYPVRWRSFLSVPVYLERPERRLIAGVVTLASSKSKSGSAIPQNRTAEMEDIVSDLISLGTRAFDVPPSV